MPPEKTSPRYNLGGATDYAYDDIRIVGGGVLVPGLRPVRGGPAGRSRRRDAARRRWRRIRRRDAGRRRGGRSPRARRGPVRRVGLAQRDARSGTTSGGGQYKSGSGSGSYTTQRGGTVDYGAAGAGGTGAGGSSAGKGVYGVSGTTAGGKSYQDYGKVGGVSGAAGTRRRADPMSTGAGRTGPSRAARAPMGAGRGRGHRPGRLALRGGGRPEWRRRGRVPLRGGGRPEWRRRGRVPLRRGLWPERGRGGRVPLRRGLRSDGLRGLRGAGYGRRSAYGTAYVPTNAMAAQGTAVRGVYAGSNYASPGFLRAQQGAWVAPAGAAAMAATAAPATWGTVAAFDGLSAQPVYNDYGGNVVSQPNAMYVNGDPVGTPEQYAQQAGQIASTGRHAAAQSGRLVAEPRATSRWPCRARMPRPPSSSSSRSTSRA